MPRCLVTSLHRRNEADATRFPCSYTIEIQGKNSAIIKGSKLKSVNIRPKATRVACRRLGILGWVGVALVRPRGGTLGGGLCGCCCLKHGGLN